LILPAKPIRSSLSFSLPAWLALVFLTPLLRAQTVGGTVDLKFRFDGKGTRKRFGFSVAGAGDVDGDGFGDLIVGVPYAKLSRFAKPGAAFVLSGATGGKMARLDGPSDRNLLGWSVSAAGDIDGDGHADLFVGSPGSSPNSVGGAGSAFVFSGATGGQLLRLDGQEYGGGLGVSVACTGDLDGDGIGDLIAGADETDANGLFHAGSAFVFSGGTGVPLFRFDGLEAGDFMGGSVASARDVNGDGFDDLIVGAVFAAPNGLADAGSAFVFSGATGAPIHRFDGLSAGERLGNAVAGAGDVDGDGFDDLVVGAVFASPGGLQYAGSAFVFSGATGTILFRCDGLKAGDRLGNSVAGAGDVDGDGFDDVVVGAPGADPEGLGDAGSMLIFSGATGTLLFRFDGQEARGALGWSVAGAGDVDRDGRSDLITGAIGTNPKHIKGAGSAFVFTFNPILKASAETLSVSAGGKIDYTINFPDADAGQEYGLLLSSHGTGPTLLKGLPVPLTRDRFFAASAQGNTPPQGIDFQGFLDSKGKAFARFTAAPGTLPARLIGRTLFLAAVDKKHDFSSVARKLVFLP